MQTLAPVAGLRGDYTGMAPDWTVPQDVGAYTEEDHAVWFLLVQRQSLNTLPELGWLMVGVLVACAGVYAVLHFAAPLSRLLGVTGIRVISRLMGLLLAVIAVQFMVNGVQAIM